MIWAMLVQVHLSDIYGSHEILSVTSIFYFLTVHGLPTPDATTATPYQLFFSSKPTISVFHVF